MTGIEVLDPVHANLPVTWTKTNMKQKLNIAEIIQNYGSRLQGFIRKRVRNIEDADDILQEVYYQLADTDRLLKPIDQIAAWLFTVARNRITDLYRKRKTESSGFYRQDSCLRPCATLKMKTGLFCSMRYPTAVVLLFVCIRI